MPTSPYDNLTTILNSCRTRLNDDVDTLVALGGQLIGNTQAFTQQMVNSAWRKLQQRLASMGYVRLQKETILGLPAIAVTDPGVQTYINWTGYYNGTGSPSAAVVLPQDLIEPIEAWERPSYTENAYTDMDIIVGGIPAVPKLQWIGMWQWRDDSMYMPGAIVDTDLRLSYASYLDDFIDTGDVTTATGFTPWYEQPVPIMRSMDALVNYILAEVATARGNAAAVLAFTADAENSTGMILDRDFMRDKGIAKASEFGKQQDRLTPGRAQ